MVAGQVAVLLIIKLFLPRLTMQHHHSSGMGAYIYLIRRLIHIHRLDILEGNSFRSVRIEQIDLIGLGRAVIEIQAAVTCTNPQVVILILYNAINHIVAQRIAERDMFYLLETIAQRMVIIQPAPICPQPHTALRIPEDTAY